MLVDNITDYIMTDGSLVTDYCVMGNWKTAAPTGICNLRIALQFCLKQPPWRRGKVVKCIIELPHNQLLNICHGELDINDLFIDSEFPVRIAFNGNNAIVKGYHSNCFLSTSSSLVNVFNTSVLYPKLSIEMHNVWYQLG